MKKGDLAVQQLIVLILLMAVFLLGGAYLGVIIFSGQQQTLESTCKTSIALAQLDKKISDNSFQIVDLYKLYCPRAVIYVGDGVIKFRNHGFNGEKNSFSDASYRVVNRDGAVISRDQVDPNNFERDMQGLLSSELVRCWQQFDEGKRDVLPDTAYIGTEKTCFVCSEIFVTNDLQVTPTPNYNWFVPLSQIQVPFNEDPRSVNEYLYFNTAPSFSKDCHDRQVTDGMPLTLELKTDETYMVLFYRLGSVLESATDIGQNDGQCQSVAIIEADQFTKTCDTLLN